MTWIVDNRDGSREALACADPNVPRARLTTFAWAEEECVRRNKSEGWMRFVPLRRRP